MDSGQKSEDKSTNQFTILVLPQGKIQIQLDEHKHLIVMSLEEKKQLKPFFLFVQLALYILAAGILSIYVNYDCDRQRQEFRRTNGKCFVWGKAPSKVIYPLYLDDP